MNCRLSVGEFKLKFLFAYRANEGRQPSQNRKVQGNADPYDQEGQADPMPLLAPACVPPGLLRFVAEIRVQVANGKRNVVVRYSPVRLHSMHLMLNFSEDRSRAQELAVISVTWAKAVIPALNQPRLACANRARMHPANFFPRHTFPLQERSHEPDSPKRSQADKAKGSARARAWAVVISRTPCNFKLSRTFRPTPASSGRIASVTIATRCPRFRSPSAA